VRGARSRGWPALAARWRAARRGRRSDAVAADAGTPSPECDRPRWADTRFGDVRRARRRGRRRDQRRLALRVRRAFPADRKETRPMLIVDAQVHIWSSGKPTNPNHRQVPVFSKDDLLKEMDEAGVDAALIHPPASWDPNSNELAVEAARQHPNRLAILGNFPLDRPESRALIDTWKSRPGMIGLRFTFLQPHQRTWPTDGTIDWLWPAAERAGIPVALLAAGFLPKVGQVAERHPRLKLIIDHLGRPSGTKDDAAWANLPEMLALAKHPNVAIKATGAPSYSSE